MQFFLWFSRNLSPPPPKLKSPFLSGKQNTTRTSIFCPFSPLFYVTRVHMHKIKIFFLLFGLSTVALLQRPKLSEVQRVGKLKSPKNMVESPSFLWLNSIPLIRHVLFSHSLVDGHRLHPGFMSNEEYCWERRNINNSLNPYRWFWEHKPWSHSELSWHRPDRL